MTKQYSFHQSPMPPYSVRHDEYICKPNGIAPIPNAHTHIPQYPATHNPLLATIKDQIKGNPDNYFSKDGVIVYSTTCSQLVQGGWYTYCLYDDKLRPIETGQARIKQVRLGDKNATRAYTNQEIAHHVLSLSERKDVLVAVYEPDQPYAPWGFGNDIHLNDRIQAVYHYTRIDAATPRGTNGQYYPDAGWLRADFRYNQENICFTTMYNCHLGPTQPTPGHNTTTEQPAQDLVACTPPQPVTIHKQPTAKTARTKRKTKSDTEKITITAPKASPSGKQQKPAGSASVTETAKIKKEKQPSPATKALTLHSSATIPNPTVAPPHNIRHKTPPASGPPAPRQ